MTLTWYITIMVQLSIADSSISSGDESEDFEEGNYDFSDDDYDIDEKVTRKKSKEPYAGQSEIQRISTFQKKKRR